PGVPSAGRQSRSACRKILSRTGRVISVSSFWREAHLHRKGHRDSPAGEDRHSIASRHVWHKQGSQRLHGGNDISKARRFFNKGGNQPLLLNNDPESQAPQLNRKPQNCPRDSSNFESGQIRNRSCSAHGIETCGTQCSWKAMTSGREVARRPWSASKKAVRDRFIELLPQSSSRILPRKKVHHPPIEHLWVIHIGTMAGIRNDSWRWCTV